MKIALAHDSFTQLGGAEKVFSSIRKLFPKSPVFTLVVDSKLASQLGSYDFRTSWLNGWYRLLPKLQYWLPVIPAAVGSLKFEGFQVVVSSSSSFIKNITVPKGSLHICYCHTPTRFLWHNKEYVRQEVPWVIRPFVEDILRFFLNRMEVWDYDGAQRVDFFIANSEEVRQRIQMYYGRDSVVIHPGIRTDFWKPTVPKEKYFLAGGRLQAHKNLDVVIDVFNEIGWILHVIGTGRHERDLKKRAGKTIRFLGRVTDEQLRDQYSGALGFIYPQLEDFGLMPLEAAACGTATLAYGKGGALETVRPGVTGEFFYEPDKEAIKEMIIQWNANRYSQAALVSHAANFTEEIFNRKMSDFIFQKINAVQ